MASNRQEIKRLAKEILMAGDFTPSYPGHRAQTDTQAKRGHTLAQKVMEFFQQQDRANELPPVFKPTMKRFIDSRDLQESTDE